LVEALAERKELDSAVAVMRLAVELSPDAAHSHFLLGMMLQQNGDRAGALAAIEKAVALQPETGWYRAQLEKLKAEPGRD
jgi:Flp pilus assembly protein TadD